MSHIIVEQGSLTPLIEFINESKGSTAINSLPAIMTLGFIAAWHDSLANSVIEKKGDASLLRVLIEVQE